MGSRMRYIFLRSAALVSHSCVGRRDRFSGLMVSCLCVRISPPRSGRSRSPLVCTELGKLVLRPVKFSPWRCRPGRLQTSLGIAHRTQVPPSTASNSPTQRIWLSRAQVARTGHECGRTNFGGLEPQLGRHAGQQCSSSMGRSIPGRLLRYPQPSLDKEAQPRARCHVRIQIRRDPPLRFSG